MVFAKDFMRWKWWMWVCVWFVLVSTWQINADSGFWEFDVRSFWYGAITGAVQRLVCGVSTPGMRTQTRRNLPTGSLDKSPVVFFPPSAVGWLGPRGRGRVDEFNGFPDYTIMYTTWYTLYLFNISLLSLSVQRSEAAVFGVEFQTEADSDSWQNFLGFLSGRTFRFQTTAFHTLRWQQWGHWCRTRSEMKIIPFIFNGTHPVHTATIFNESSTSCKQT